MTQPDHRQGRELVEDELLRGAGGQPGGALDDLGPDRDDDREVGRALHGRPRGAHERGAGRAAPAALGQRGQRVGRRAAGRDGHEQVTPGQTHLAEVGDGRVLVVLEALGRVTQRTGAARDDRHEGSLDPVGRAHLGGVLRRDAAGRARADVDHAPAPAEHLDGELDESGHLGGRPRDEARDGRVVPVHEREPLGGRHQVERDRPHDRRDPVTRHAPPPVLRVPRTVRPADDWTRPPVREFPTLLV